MARNLTHGCKRCSVVPNSPRTPLGVGQRNKSLQKSEQHGRHGYSGSSPDDRRPGRPQPPPQPTPHRKTAMTWWLSLAGLLAGFLGALFLTISQQPDRAIVDGRPHGKEVEHLVLECPRLWKW